MRCTRSTSGRGASTTSGTCTRSMPKTKPRSGNSIARKTWNGSTAPPSPPACCTHRVESKQAKHAHRTVLRLTMCTATQHTSAANYAGVHACMSLGGVPHRMQWVVRVLITMPPEPCKSVHVRAPHPASVCSIVSAWHGAKGIWHMCVAFGQHGKARRASVCSIESTR